MEITTSQEQASVPVTVLSLSGTLRENESLQNAAQAAYDGGARHLVIDFSKVDYMSSAGLRALHFIFTLLRQGESEEEATAVKEGIKNGAYKSPNLKLVGINDRVFEVLSLTGYDMFIDILPDLKGAIDSL